MITRREFIKKTLWTSGGMAMPFGNAAAISPVLRVALLHMAPVPGDIAGNRLMVEKAVSTAAAHNAQWIITPELCTSGYDFSDTAGTDWIRPQPGKWLQGFSKQVARLGVTTFLSIPERDLYTGKMYNCVFIIGPDGISLGKHRKIRTIKGGSESWSTPGNELRVFPVHPLGNVGLLICADAYPPWIARQLKKMGARILISPASWSQGPYGPSGEWERCSKDTGLTILVCNRTGMDRTLDFRDAQSAVISQGKRLHTMVSKTPALFLIDLDPLTGIPFSRPPLKIS